MEKPTLKQMLKNLLASYELQYIENTVLKDILTRCADAHVRHTWRQDVYDVLHDPKLMKAAHAAFEPIYAQIDAASDEAAVIELLSRIPTTGKTN